MAGRSLLVEFDERAAEVKAGGLRYGPLRELLQFARLNKIHRPRDILELGTALLRNKSSLAHEAWNVLEQVFMAALDCSDAATAKSCLDDLQRHFPADKSARVQLLVGRWHEFNGNTKEAEVIYRKLYDSNHANTMAVKRLVALEISAGNTNQAVTMLKEYLSTFSSDMQAWHELGELYLEAGQFADAMFCFEELVVLNPLNDVWHCLVGECLLTLGGSHEKLAEQSRQARKHFSQAVKLSRGRNARALIGLALATSAVDSTVRGRGRTDAGAGAGAGAGAATTNDTLRDVALSGLEKLYKSASSAGTKSQKLVLEALRA